jgi:polar amino acid transport system substrate-binding protein
MVTLCLFSGCASSGGSPDHTNHGPDPNVLRVGVTANMPPMIFKQGQEYTGLEADLARALAADLGKNVRFVELRWDDQIDALLNGRTDIIMSNLSITPSRSMRIDFTKPYLRSGQAALVRRDEAAAMRIGIFTAQRRIGVQRATTGDYYVQQDLSRANRITYASATAGAQALIDKRIDVFIHDAPVNWWLASENEAKGLTVIPALLTQEFLAWGVRKDETDLRDAANRFIDKAQQNGQMQSAINRWIPRWN